MNYTAKVDEWGETRHHCGDCDVIMWHEDDIRFHWRSAHGVNIKTREDVAGGMDRANRAARELELSHRLDEAGREIRELRRKVDALIARQEFAKAIQEAREKAGMDGYKCGYKYGYEAGLAVGGE